MTDPIVVVPEDRASLDMIGKALGALDEVARRGSFSTRSATGQRVCLQADHEGLMHEVVVRNGCSGGPSDGIGMNVIHRVAGRRSATIQDMSTAPDRIGRLRSKRTMHDHRPRIEGWRRLFDRGLQSPGRIHPAALAALDFCQAHIAASMETGGMPDRMTVHLALAAGDMPLRVRIASVEIHIDWRFVVDDYPRMSRELERHLAPRMPQGWSFNAPNQGDVIIAPLHVGQRIVTRSGTMEALRTLASPNHVDVGREFE